MASQKILLEPPNILRAPWNAIFGKGYTKSPEVFPEQGLAVLHLSGAMQAAIPIKYGGAGLGHTSGNFALLDLLRQVGAYDLSLGRIYEGHVNALLLIELFGTREQQQTFFQEAFQGMLFGVWNSELPMEAMAIKNMGTSCFLTGAKIFCSGANYVQRPLITAEGPSGKQLVILHLDELDLEEDYSYWNPMGMKGSVSCRFDFTGVSVHESQVLGEAGDYEREPDFSGGAIRFAAVQLGGAQAAIRAAMTHLQHLGRADHPDQLRRVSQLAILQERGMAWLQRVAAVADNKQKHPDEYVYFANICRTEIRHLSEEILHLCELCVGLQGMMAPHPLERIHRDLSVYLKQPGPDRVRAQIGSHFSTQNEGL